MRLTLLAALLAPTAFAWSAAPAACPTLMAGGCRQAASRLPVAAIRMQQHDDDEEDMGDAEVELIESGSGGVLPCFMAASLEYEGATFAALYPVNAPVSLAQQQVERLVPLEDESPEVLAAAAEACRENDIDLLQTPVVLTACGPGLEIVEGDAEALEYTEGDDEETEEALLLAEFEHKGMDLLVVQMLDPLYVVGKRSETDEKKFSVPSDDEMDAVSDTIEQLVIEFEEGFDDDDDDDFMEDFAA